VSLRPAARARPWVRYPAVTDPDALALTVDVECDSDGGRSWRNSDPLTFRNVEHGIGEVLSAALDETDACATLLVSNVVLEHPASVEVLRGLARVELGAHLHGDFLEPGRCDPAGAVPADGQQEYDEALERAKLESLGRLFRDAFGTDPRSFRAGRWSLGPRTGRLLGELGYIADASVTPHKNWYDGIDFRGAPEQPYPLDPPVWEFPVSIVSGWWTFGKACWLRPSLSPRPLMRAVLASLPRRHPTPRTFVAMLHSSELTPGASPYSHRPVAARLRWLLRHAADSGMRFATLGELARERQSASRPAATSAGLR
jgi:peptidoglycan/xylan/chitin deacetylase (PgdA/CDA1 family)